PWPQCLSRWSSLWPLPTSGPRSPKKSPSGRTLSSAIKAHPHPPLEPLCKLLYPCFNRRRRLVTEQSPRLGDVGVCERHVAGLRRAALDARLPAQGFFEQFDHPIDRDGLRLAQVDNLEGRGVVFDRGHHALQDVVDVGEIPFGRAVAVNLDGAAAG